MVYIYMRHTTTAAWLQHQKALQDSPRNLDKLLVLLKMPEAQVNQTPKINQDPKLIYALDRFY